MKKSREELDKLHKEKCRELKRVRAQIAADLGVDLKQRECTYEGYCSGTCPKCKSEEMMLNLAIMKRQMESADVRRRVATAGITTAAALSLTGCNIAEIGTMEGDVQVVPTVEELSGDVEMLPSPEVEDIQGGIAYIEPETCSEEVIDGKLEVPETVEGLIVPESSEEWELAGDIMILEETEEEKGNE